MLLTQHHELAHHAGALADTHSGDSVASYGRQPRVPYVAGMQEPSVRVSAHEIFVAHAVGTCSSQGQCGLPGGFVVANAETTRRSIACV